MSSNKTKTTIYLCDLTHTGQQIANDTIPLRIGYLASWLNKTAPDKVEVKLFKYPEELNKGLEKEIPNIIGFSNYVWNMNLNYGFTERIKEVKKDAIVIFGGPNYPIDKEERMEFFKKFPLVDFYIKKEGEIAFADLVKALLENNLSINKTKENKQLKSIDFIKNGEFRETELLPRIKNLDDIDSPYLEGFLDNFFDRRLIPFIQLDRGCPFSCTYCAEGTSYHSGVFRHSAERIKKELVYIAQHSEKIHGLRIASSNFGMYRQDIETAREIAKVKSRTGWPDYINVATGKTNHDLIAETTKILEGGLRVSAAVQSTDSGVLKNIKRKNISLEEIFNFVKKSRQTEGNIYSEVILGLPGDNKKTFLKSIEDLIELDLNLIVVYTLMFLDGSELASRESLTKYGFVQKYRVLPRGFGEYDILGKKYKIAEIEKVGVASKTLSFEDYLWCRAFSLVLNLFYNDNIFEKLTLLLKKYHVPLFKWLREIFDLTARSSEYPEITRLFEKFTRETKEELWNSEEELREFIAEEGIIEKYINGELGANLTFKCKTLVLVNHSRALHEIAFRAAQKLISSKLDHSEGNLLDDFLKELKEFSILEKENLFDIEKSKTQEFKFNFMRLNQVSNLDFSIESLREKTKIKFFHDESQKNTITKNLGIYGKDIMGITRIMTLTYVKKFFRRTTVA